MRLERGKEPPTPPRGTRVPAPNDLFPRRCERSVIRVHVYPHFVPGNKRCSHVMQCRTFQTSGTFYTQGNNFCTRVQNAGAPRGVQHPWDPPRPDKPLPSPSHLVTRNWGMRRWVFRRAALSSIHHHHALHPKLCMMAPKLIACENLCRRGAVPFGLKGAPGIAGQCVHSVNTGGRVQGQGGRNGATPKPREVRHNYGIRADATACEHCATGFDTGLIR